MFLNLKFKYACQYLVNLVKIKNKKFIHFKLGFLTDILDD